MFNFSAFLKKGFISAIGRMPTHQIILNAAGWHEKGKLTEEDLVEINAAIETADQEKETEG